MVCDGCIHDESLKDRFEPMTNADRIRGMTDEELAKFLMSRHLTCRKCFFERRNRKDPTGVCWECTLAYLRRSPVEESNE